MSKDWYKKVEDEPASAPIPLPKSYPVPISDDRLYTTSELALIFRKKADAICVLIRTGKLEAQWDGQWLVLGKKYREYLEREQTRKLTRGR